jgi:hypothetical protein
MNIKDPISYNLENECERSVGKDNRKLILGEDEEEMRK